MDHPFVEKLLTVVDKFKLPLIIGLAGLLLIGLGFLLPSFGDEKKDLVVESSEPKQDGSSISQIKVDVSGAVKNPGVYSLISDSRIEDALKIAGGFSDEADPDWVAKNINLASKVSDGQKIYINAKGEVSGSNSVLDAKSVSDKVNVNFASLKELDTLPGVGEVTAEKIISGRPYNTVEDLLNKKAVGKATFEKIKDLVSVN